MAQQIDLNNPNDKIAQRLNESEVGAYQANQGGLGGIIDTSGKYISNDGDVGNVMPQDYKPTYKDTVVYQKAIAKMKPKGKTPNLDNNKTSNIKSDLQAAGIMNGETIYIDPKGNQYLGNKNEVRDMSFVDPYANTNTDIIVPTWKPIGYSDDGQVIYNNGQGTGFINNKGDVVPYTGKVLPKVSIDTIVDKSNSVESLRQKFNDNPRDFVKFVSAIAPVIGGQSITANNPQGVGLQNTR